MYVLVYTYVCVPPASPTSYFFQSITIIIIIINIAAVIGRPDMWGLPALCQTPDINKPRWRTTFTAVWDSCAVRLGTCQAAQRRGLTSHWIAARGISLLWQLSEWEQTLIYPWRLQNIILCHALLHRTSSQPMLPTVMQHIGQDLTANWVTLLHPLKTRWLLYVPLGIHHSFSSLSYDRFKASSKASSPHIAIQIFLLQMRVSSPFLKVIQ